MQRFLYFCLCLLPVALFAQDVADCSTTTLSGVTIPAGSYHLYGNPSLLTAGDLNVEPNARLDLKSETDILIQQTTLVQAGSNGSTWAEINLCTVNTEEAYPNSFQLLVQSNPMQDELRASYSIDQDAKIRWVLYAADGRFIQKSQPTDHPPGTYPIEINTQQLAPGLYFLQLQVDGKSVTEKVVKI